MTTIQQIEAYIASIEEPKQTEFRALNTLVKSLAPQAKLWFLDGKNDEGKVVSNPNIGFGQYTLNYANGSSKEFYRVGLSANTSGISVYIMGIEDKHFLKETFGKNLGKANITSYCIKFKSIKDINLKELEAAITFGLTRN